MLRAGIIKPVAVHLETGSGVLKNFRLCQAVAKIQIRSDDTQPSEKALIAKTSTYLLRLIGVSAIIRIAEGILEEIEFPDIDPCASTQRTTHTQSTQQYSAQAVKLKSFFQADSWNGRTLSDPQMRELMIHAAKVLTKCKISDFNQMDGIYSILKPIVTGIFHNNTDRCIYALNRDSNVFHPMRDPWIGPMAQNTIASFPHITQ